MTRLVLLLLASAIATPASAQSHQGHHMPMPGMSAPKKSPAKPATAKPKKAKAAPAKARPKAAPRTKAVQPPPSQPSPAADPHAGHQMPASDPHAGHGPATPAPPVAPPPPAALTGPDNVADSVFGNVAMADAREELRREHGAMPASKILIDQFEARIRDGRDGYFVDAEAWHGGDIDKLWLKTEIEGDRGQSPDHAEAQALWSHAIDPWFDLQTGIRYDANRGPNRGHLVLGVEGLAPYWWEVEGALFLSNKGELTARVEAEHDLRITQKLILQPRLELDFSAQDIEELGIGSGLSTADAGLRLRYQVTPLVAPYVGFGYERAFGDTRRFNDDSGGLNLITGIRFWF